MENSEYLKNYTWENIQQREGKTFSHIEKVDWLRTEIQKIIDNTTDFSQEKEDIELEQSFVYKYLCEAKFWLGFELSRYRDENKK